MKIKTKKHGSQQASILEDKSGKIIIRFAEIETQISSRGEIIDADGDQIAGKLERATESELCLLRKLANKQIEIHDDFICCDIYHDTSTTEHQVTWNTRNDRVTVNTDTNVHLLDGKVITIEDLLRRHNLGLL